MSAKEQVTEILDDRQGQYGDATDTLQLIADYWNSFLNGAAANNAAPRSELTPAEVAQMMVLFKVARAQRGRFAENGDPTDDMLDTIGYATIAADAQRKTEEATTERRSEGLCSGLNWHEDEFYIELERLYNYDLISENAFDEIQDSLAEGRSWMEILDVIDGMEFHGVVDPHNIKDAKRIVLDRIKEEGRLNALS